MHNAHRLHTGSGGGRARLSEQLARTRLRSRLLWAHLPRATSNPCPWSRHVDGGCGPTCCAFWDRRRHALVSAVLRFFSSMHGNCEWGHACVMCEPPGSVLSVARRSDRCCGVWYCNIVGKSVRWEFLDADAMPRLSLRLLLSTHPVAHETVARRYGPVIKIGGPSLIPL